MAACVVKVPTGLCIGNPLTGEMSYTSPSKPYVVMKEKQQYPINRSALERNFKRPDGTTLRPDELREGKVYKVISDD